MNMFEGICGRIAPGLCRIALSGSIAVKTESGYRAWDPEKRRLTNCDQFVLDVGDDFFFVVPTSKVAPGDIILSGGKPRCVLEAGGDTITVISYEDATVQTLLPERHMFMENTYLYGKVVSMFGRSLKGRKGANRMMKHMLLAGMLKGQGGQMHSLLPLMLMGGKADFLDDLFDQDDPDEKEA